MWEVVSPNEAITLCTRLSERKNLVVQFLKIRSLCVYGEFVPGSLYAVIIIQDRFLRQARRSFSCRAGCDTGCRAGCFQHLVESYVFYIRITGLVAGQYAYAHTEIDIGGSAVYGSVLQSDVIPVGMFKEKIGIVAAFFKCCCQHFLHVAFTDTKMVLGE